MGAHLAGYGTQTGIFARRLLEHADVRVSSFYGLEGMALNWEGLKVLPGLGGGSYGNAEIPHHCQKFFGDPKGGLLVTLMDVWVLDPAMIRQHHAASWVPVDHDPAPPRVLNFFAQSGAVPIAMSRFGEDRLGQFDPLYVPHGVETGVLRPVDKLESRKLMGVGEDDFLVGMVAANKGNPSRKSFVAALEAFAEFRKRHANARLYLHTDLDGVYSAGVPLGPVIRALEIPPESIGTADPYSVHFQPMGTDLMAHVYSAMDVLLNPAMGEGFGIPVLEAQACGTPVIVTDFSAMSELCGAGWKVDCSRWWTPQEAWQAQPHVRDIVDALEQAYTLPQAGRDRMSAQAREFALQYDADRVLEEFMLPALEAAWERMSDRPVELVA